MFDPVWWNQATAESTELDRRIAVAVTRGSTRVGLAQELGCSSSRVGQRFNREVARLNWAVRHPKTKLATEILRDVWVSQELGGPVQVILAEGCRPLRVAEGRA